MRIWLLPEYIEDILPPEAARIEALRTRLLELFRVHGYRLVIPPMLEYVESLLTGTGHDLDLRTFKLVDQLSGRMMGIRADITPQVARIDAHLLNEQGGTRLCYAGSGLRGASRCRSGPSSMGTRVSKAIWRSSACCAARSNPAASIKRAWTSATWAYFVRSAPGAACPPRWRTSCTLRCRRRTFPGSRRSRRGCALPPAMPCAACRSSMATKACSGGRAGRYPP